MKPIPYVPKVRVMPGRILDVGSAWRGIESILFSLIKEFGVGTGLAVEFGVESGYSAAALANYFGVVIAVDHFSGLGHDAESFYPAVKKQLSVYPNIAPCPQSWEDFSHHYDDNVIDFNPIDLIHIDMDHNYQQTFEAGDWAVQHAPVVIFHDTLSWPDDVGRACEDLADKHSLHYHNYEDSHGLGILSRKGKL